MNVGIIGFGKIGKAVVFVLLNIQSDESVLMYSNEACFLSFSY